MLGLGTDILHQSSLSESLQDLVITDIGISDSPNTANVQVDGAFPGVSTTSTMTSFASASIGDQLPGTFSLEVIRYSASNVQEATLTFTVYAYKQQDILGNVARFKISTVNSSSLSISTFDEGGSSLIDFDTLGISDDAGDHGYAATLTVSQSGFATASSPQTSIISMTTE